MKKNQLLIAASLLLLASPAKAKVGINIYNNNFALVKDIREVELNSGRQRLYFDGVSAKLNPESSFVLGHDIKVIEKNYDYNLINNESMLNHFIGKEIKTATTNPENGEDIIKKATVIANNYGVPVLKFDYGIETNYKGRIIFDELPKSLSAKPQLQVVLDNKIKGKKELELLYLTSGINWKADYIADVKNDDTLDLATWVTITNNTGVDYENAEIRVVAGDVAKTNITPRIEMYADANVMAKSSMSLGASASQNTAQPVGDYYFYNIDNKTTIKNNQSKQISLFNKKDVKFKKIYKIISPLYIARSAKQSTFKKINPNILYSIKNNADSNLDVLLPSGTVRFYENSTGNTTFLGEAPISQTAAGETIELSVGTTSDIYAKAKVTNVSQISKEITDAEVLQEFYNTKDKPQEILFEQKISGDWRMLSESLASTKKDAKTAQWVVTIPANSSTTLTYKVRIEN